MQAFAHGLPQAIFYCSNGFSLYSEIIWPGEGAHLVWHKKERTYTIESSNAQLRTYLARLKRKSGCFSRCIKALWRAGRLFVWHYNRRQRRINSDPLRFKHRLPLLF